MKPSWNLSENCLKPIWSMPESSLNPAWNLPETSLKPAWTYRKSYLKPPEAIWSHLGPKVIKCKIHSLRLRNFMKKFSKRTMHSKCLNSKKKTIESATCVCCDSWRSWPCKWWSDTFINYTRCIGYEFISKVRGRHNTPNCVRAGQHPYLDTDLY